MGRKLLSLGLSLTLLALLALYVGVATARDFGRPNPYQLAAGIREIMPSGIAPLGHYGKAWPLRPLYPKELGNDDASPAAGCGDVQPAAPTIDLGRTQPMATPAPDPGFGTAPGLNRGDGAIDSPMLNVLSGGSAGSPARDFEDDLRGLIQRLHQN